jgi:hypothetical protein
VSAQPDSWIAVLHDTRGNRLRETEIPGSPPHHIHLKASMIGRRESSLIVFRMVGDVGDYGGKLGQRIAYIECGSNSLLAWAMDEEPAVSKE